MSEPKAADFSGNFSRVQNALIQRGHLAQLERGEIAIYLLLSAMASPEIYASFFVEELCAASGIDHPATVRRAIRSLAKSGLITLEVSAAGSGNLRLWRVGILQPPVAGKAELPIPQNRERTGAPAHLFDDPNVRPRTQNVRGRTFESAPAHSDIKEERKERNTRKDQERARDVEIEMPTILASDPAFIAAWDQWLQYRSEIRKPYKPTGMRVALQELADWGPKKATDSLRQSMARGWQGYFEPKESGVIAARHNGNSKRATAAERGEFPETGFGPIQRQL